MEIMSFSELEDSGKQSEKFIIILVHRVMGSYECDCYPIAIFCAFFRLAACSEISASLNVCRAIPAMFTSICHCGISIVRVYIIESRVTSSFDTLAQLWANFFDRGPHSASLCPWRAAQCVRGSLAGRIYLNQVGGSYGANTVRNRTFWRRRFGAGLFGATFSAPGHFGAGKLDAGQLDAKKTGRRTIGRENAMSKTPKL